MRLFSWLLLIFLFFLGDFVLVLLSVKFLGLYVVVMYCSLKAVLAAIFVRYHAVRVMKMQDSLGVFGMLSLEQSMPRALLVVSGIFFIFPGYITDIIGLLLLPTFVRKKIYPILIAYFAKKLAGNIISQFQSASQFYSNERKTNSSADYEKEAEVIDIQ